MNEAAKQTENNVSHFHDTLNDYLEQQEKTDAAADAEEEEENEEQEEAAEDKIDIYSLQPTEFIEMYKALSVEEKQHLLTTYKDIFEARLQLNERMAELKAWCEERNIDLPTYRAVYKRANDPKKKQNMIDATFVYFAKELGGGYQPGLFDALEPDLHQGDE